MSNIILNKYNCCDFSKVDSIGVICRGQSLGSIGEYKENFKNIFVVGQHLNSFDIIGKHIADSNIVRVSGATFFKPSKRYLRLYNAYNMRDIQTALDPTKSPRKELKFKKMKETHKGVLEAHPMPVGMLDRNKRFISKKKYGNGKITYPTIGLFGVDLASAYKPKEIHVIGLDFYCVPQLSKECANVSWKKNMAKGDSMREHFNLICEEEKDIQFYLYTCCKKVESTENLKVINV